MIDILTAIFIISSTAAGLAAILVVAERFFADYGECLITINNDEKRTVKGGGSLLESLTSEKIFIPSACGGRGTCGYCKCKVLKGGGILLPTEEPYLSAEEKKNNMRLSCQIKIREDIDIEIPEELLAVKEYKVICKKIVDLTYDMKQFIFSLQEPAKISYTPGQYVQLFAPKYDGNTEEVYRAYSISSDPADNTIVELIIRLVPNGICTTYCFKHLKEGDQALLNGPYGDFRLTDTNAKIIFIAGGSGIAPIKCMLHHMQNITCLREAVFYFGVNSEKDLCMVDTMRAFEKTLPKFKFVPVMSRPEHPEKWKGETGLVTEAVLRNEKNADQSEAYLCGSPGMIDASIVVLKKLGMKESNIFYDKFS